MLLELHIGQTEQFLDQLPRNLQCAGRSKRNASLIYTGLLMPNGSHWVNSRRVPRRHISCQHDCAKKNGNRR
jgi:hypothetical protein